MIGTRNETVEIINFSGIKHVLVDSAFKTESGRIYMAPGEVISVPKQVYYDHVREWLWARNTKTEGIKAELLEAWQVQFAPPTSAEESLTGVVMATDKPESEVVEVKKSEESEPEPDDDGTDDGVYVAEPSEPEVPNPETVEPEATETVESTPKKTKG
jgi:hypothetical protein